MSRVMAERELCTIEFPTSDIDGKRGYAAHK